MDLGTRLSIADITLTLIGFLITVIAALGAKNAADKARSAAENATRRMMHVDLIAEIATVIQLLEELKRLHRAKSIDLLPDRYSRVRTKIGEVRVSSLISSDTQRTSLQDVVTVIATLEKSLDTDNSILENGKQIARFNQQLSDCIDKVLELKEQVRTEP